MIATDYATKWVEAKALKANIAIVIVRFLYEYILTIVIDQGIHFINDTIKHLTK
jgi:hypothetical protein